MIAERIVAALLDSDQEMLQQFANLAVDPLAAIKYALERGEEEYVHFPCRQLNSFHLDINVKGIGITPANINRASRMVNIRWLHESSWGTKAQGGGWFFVRPEQFRGLFEALDKLVEECSKAIHTDEYVRTAYSNVLRWRFSAPRKPHARQKYTETGLYAYFR